MVSGAGVEQIKCGADERRRRGLDRAAHLFSPKAKMQIDSRTLPLDFLPWRRYNSVRQLEFDELLSTHEFIKETSK